MNEQGIRQRRSWIASIIFICAGLLALTTQALAAERKFHMALFGSDDPNYTDLAWFSGGPQPPGRSILAIDPSTNPAGLAYDWSRIAAVMIDEPYWIAAHNAIGYDDDSNPCWNPSDPRNAGIAVMMNTVANTAAAFKSVAPNTRFWINFSVPEMNWMIDPYCTIFLNQPYIDVISLDKYDTDFSGVQPYYDWLYWHRAKNSQQFALVPGTFYMPPENSGEGNYRDPYTAAARLQGYFDYANNLNSAGWDAPMVWLIAGWPAGDSNPYIGILVPGPSVYMLAAWQWQFINQRVDKFAGVVEYFDPSTGLVSGWAVDRSQETPPYVDFWVDGWLRYWGGTIANQYRPDVGAYYGTDYAGYTFWGPVIPDDGACHHVDAWAVAPTVGNGVMMLSPLVSTDFCFGGWYPPPDWTGY